MHSWRRRLAVAIAPVALLVGASAAPASAAHTWGDYHWSKGSAPVALNLGDNLTPDWDQDLRTASADWSASSVLDTTVVPGSTNTPKRCAPTTGMVEVCNAKYGSNGWLGLAQIWLQNGHIVQGTAKMNDTYFGTPAYNVPDKRLHVMCQEVGHTFGLGHQDESGASLGTCMDYASDSTNSQHPNAHDYELLEQIYAHADSASATTNTKPGRGANAVDVDERREWGRLVEKHGNHEVFVRHFGNGLSVVTFVTGVE